MNLDDLQTATTMLARHTDTDAVPWYCTLYKVHCTGYTVPGTLYQVHCTGYTVPGTLYQVHCTGYTVPGTLYKNTVPDTLRYTVPAQKVGIEGKERVQHVDGRELRDCLLRRGGSHWNRRTLVPLHNRIAEHYLVVSVRNSQVCSDQKQTASIESIPWGRTTSTN